MTFATLFDQARQLDVVHVAFGVIAISIFLVVVFAKGWQRANARRTGLQRELAQKGAFLSDAKDKLLLEERNSEALSRALDSANDAISAEEYKLQFAREKIASLNAESDTVYEDYLQTRAELRVSGVALQYWQYFARRVFATGRSHLAEAEQSIKDSLRMQSLAALAAPLERVEFSLELIELANTPDLPRRIRDMRADGTREVIHLLPRLKRFAEEQEQTLGARFTTGISVKDKAVLFAGSWMHVELVLTTLLNNAIKHGIEATPIEFEFSTADRIATMQVTNLSPTPVSDAVIGAANEMMTGDPKRTRFGLYLIEQIANGYRAIFKVENVGFSEERRGHVVRASFSFSLR